MSDRQTVTHELKTEPQYFEASLRGDKPYEIRRNDRGFAVGDYLRLREFDRRAEVYSGREMTVVVTHILSGAPYVPEGYVAMGVRRVVGEGELAELRRIAEEATPGPWEVYGPHYGSDVMQHATGVCAEDEYGCEFDICRAPGERDEAAESADMEYIAALDPATVLALLDEIERLRRERETLAAAVMAQRERNEHIAECEQCNYELCPVGGELSYRAKRALVTAIAILDGEKGGNVNPLAAYTDGQLYDELHRRGWVAATWPTKGGGGA